MLTFTEADVLAWLTPLLWPFLRVVALFSALPVLAQRTVPARAATRNISMAGSIRRAIDSTP